MRNRILIALISLTTFIVLLFGLGAGQVLVSASMMPAMDQPMSRSQCQLFCTPQANPTIRGQKIITEKKQIEPQPAEPYYTVFIGVGWSLIILFIFYLRWQLGWKPPDLVVLNANFRI